MKKRLLKILKLFLIFLPLLLFLGLLNIFFYFFYQLLILTIGVMLVWCLKIFMQISRSKLWKMSLGLLMGVVIFCTSFLAIPDVNFWITFNPRQDIVNKFLEDNLITRTENSFLGESNYYSNTDGVKVFFTIFKPPNRLGSRVFFIYSNRKSVSEHKMHMRELTKNWYFGSGTYAD